MPSHELYPQDYGAVPLGGHCGVLAVAILAGRTFQEAWDALKPGRTARWQGGTSHPARMRVLEAWGVKVRKTLHMTARELRYTKGQSPLASYDRALPRCTVETFARRYAKPGVTYMLRIRGHVLTLRDGLTIDQNEACPVEQYSLRNSIVTISTERL